jgi:polysaccharide deacetylase family protein (PEP-CTERM system associated)
MKENASNNLAPANALSVDVEEHFMVEAFADRISPDTWPTLPSRVVENTHRVLTLFAQHRMRATFFVVGWVAERYPGLVREISAAGHEVACHSYLHQAIWKLSPEQFRQDTRRALSAIEDATGKKVQGYRAPTFSVVDRTLWALDILAELGLQYDSSIFPVHHDTYGIPDAPRFTFSWKLASGSLFEMPMTTARVFRRNLPGGGGGYLRILPLFYNRWIMRRIVDHEKRPVVLYFHPWEIDPEQPRMSGTWKSRLRHYRNLHDMERRLSVFLADHRFAPLCEVLQAEIQRNPPVIQR